MIPRLVQPTPRMLRYEGWAVVGLAIGEIWSGSQPLIIQTLAKIADVIHLALPNRHLSRCLDRKCGVTGEIKRARGIGWSIYPSWRHFLAGKIARAGGG